MCKPASGLSRSFFLTISSLLFMLAASVTGGTVRQVLVGPDIPSRLFIGSHHIFDGSDSLYFNGRHLRRGVDYSFASGQGAFDLSSLEPTVNDTLIASYHRLPEWLKTSYGASLPTTTPAQPTVPEFSTDLGLPGRAADESSVSLTGAKTFRFLARTNGPSQFSQSLDLSVEGELAPGVIISGAVSDRGYDPSYGTADSRLNELDKVRLQLNSPSVTAQIGDISVSSRISPSRVIPRALSGVRFMVHKPNWRVDALAARPKGRFASVRIAGDDGLQGPYFIGESSRIQPIVPGSESVWLDGERLERGTTKDYTMEYPVGGITFNVNHPIDRRSRIEIDFEPLIADYKGELLSMAGGAVFGDSMFSVDVEVQRDGDDKDQPLWGELSAANTELLSELGDSTQQAVRSSATEDSLGAYRLIADSLPDSVFQYVGVPNGDYRVTFSFVGLGAGSYRFLGADVYEFSGAGQGDYLPLVTLAAAVRTDHYRLRARLKTATLGTISTDVRQSRFDRNLFSSLDDDNNDGLYYRVNLDKRFGREDELTLTVRHRQSEYMTLERLNEPEFRREFLLPRQYDQDDDETVFRGRSVARPFGFLTVRSEFGRLQYAEQFQANKGHLGLQVQPHDRVDITLEAYAIRSEFSPDAQSRQGDGENLLGRVRFGLTKNISLTSLVESDNRKHEYNGIAQGTRYLRSSIGLSGENENLRFEQYGEDSLVTDWQQSLRRRRIALASNRRIGEMSYQLTVTHQWLDGPSITERSFLGRLGYRYHSQHRRLTIEGAYTISTESRHARGLTYLEVEPGRGDFIFEDSIFVPDPDGNFIQVDQLLSERSRVRRGEKSFHLRREFNHVYVRFNSRINEELLDGGNRGLLWSLPFYSDESEPYLFYDRQYDSDLRLWKVGGFHVINLSYRETMQRRQVADAPRLRRQREESLNLKEVALDTYLEQKLELFQVDRDRYYGSSGEIDGYKISISARRRITVLEITTTGSYRRAKSSTDELSQLYTVSLNARWQMVRKGELRSSLEGYSQRLTNVGGSHSYFLTDNRPGEKGAIWSVNLNYGVKGEVRLNFSLTGRHADNRTARLTGRTEMVAGF
ncbi:MAG: hypothetical protein OEV49_04055 [candidate division Zixibacteria bacterium]|nr:hypothetical protein [candidate division Zixibacteria bacterium]